MKIPVSIQASSQPIIHAEKKKRKSNLHTLFSRRISRDEINKAFDKEKEKEKEIEENEKEKFSSSSNNNSPTFSSSPNLNRSLPNRSKSYQFKNNLQNIVFNFNNNHNNNNNNNNNHDNNNNNDPDIIPTNNDNENNIIINECNNNSHNSNNNSSEEEPVVEVKRKRGRSMNSSHRSPVATSRELKSTKSSNLLTFKSSQQLTSPPSPSSSSPNSPSSSHHSSSSPTDELGTLRSPKTKSSSSPFSILSPKRKNYPREPHKFVNSSSGNILGHSSSSGGSGNLSRSVRKAKSKNDVFSECFQRENDTIIIKEIGKNNDNS